MAQSLVGVYAHLVFSTKKRHPVLRESLRDPLHRYAAAVLQGLGCLAVEINSVDDHIHLLISMGKQASISEVVRVLKTSTSAWIKRQGRDLAGFAWQSGYAMFSVSPGGVETVREYVVSQQRHHGKIDFQTELRALLSEARVEFDERYLWD